MGGVIAAFLIYGLFLYKKLNHLLDSDMSSELVLSNLLAQEKNIISPNWFYSTELRFLNTQLVFSFFFLFLKSWFQVRFFSTLVLNLLLVSSFYYLAKQLKINNYIWIVIIALLVPFSRIYFDFILYGCYYIPHLTISFLIVGLIFQIMNTKVKRLSLILTITLILLSFLAGIGGPRHLIILYLPLIFTSIIWLAHKLLKFKNIKLVKKDICSNKTSIFITLSIIGFTSAVIGFFINSSILSKYYSFHSFNGINYTTFNYEIIFRAIGDFLRFYGFSTGPILSTVTIQNIIGFTLALATIVAIIHSLKSKDTSVVNKLLSIFFLSAIATYILLYSFSDMNYSAIYCLPVLIFSFAIIIINLKELKCSNKLKNILSIILICMISINAICNYRIIYQENRTQEQVEIVHYLKTQNYSSGYATFWNANLLAELSSGDFKMYSWSDSGNDGAGMASVQNINDLYKWLQPKSNFNSLPKGKIFTLYSRNELNHCRWKDQLKDEDIVYSTSNYIVYGYDNYSELLNDLTEK